ncbi:MAG TPA: hypothetical protein PLY93_14635 [Turneriella sp.]|nr:hypothetical protein [Turneriella sp.]
MQNPFKRIFKRNENITDSIAPQTAVESASQSAHTVLDKRKNNVQRKKRIYKSSSPYIFDKALAARVEKQLVDELQKNVAQYRTDKWSLLEIADQILKDKIGIQRPPQLRAHRIFDAFVRIKKSRSTLVKGDCHEWRGTVKNSEPVITTLNSQSNKRIVVDTRKYILENPRQGKRRNFRSKPFNVCGNTLCVNPQHIEMRGKERAEKAGENHPRAKYPDSFFRKIAKEYNAGATAKELGEKYNIGYTYIEAVMRKEKRIDATEGMTIRGRFTTY